MSEQPPKSPTPSQAIEVLFEDYRIVREAEAGRGRYTVYRPDGTRCCDGAAWAEVERVIERDRKQRGT